jgi:ABC-2 type transport system permease protein
LGWMFFGMLSFYQQQVNQFAQLSWGQKPTLSDQVVRPMFGNLNVVLLFVAPLVTMRLLAEERKDHTIELLLTAPIKSFEIILGKFLSGVLFLMALVACTLVYPAILFLLGNPDPGVLFSCYLGVFFIILSYVGVGLFWSSRTENQIVAALLTFCTILFFWLVSWASNQVGTFVGDILNHLSLIMHFQNFASGSFDTSDVIFYLTFTAFMLFLTHVALDVEDWS